MKKSGKDDSSSRSQEEEYELFHLNRLISEGDKVLRAFPTIQDPEEIFKHYLQNYHFFK
jgi:hypothetical protein